MLSTAATDNSCRHYCILNFVCIAAVTDHDSIVFADHLGKTDRADD